MNTRRTPTKCEDFGGSRALLPLHTHRVLPRASADFSRAFPHRCQCCPAELPTYWLERVLLRGLSQQDVARFIEVAAGVDPPSGLAEAVHTQTEGNPLFVTEVVRLLVQEGELTQEVGCRRLAR